MILERYGKVIPPKKNCRRVEIFQLENSKNFQPLWKLMKTYFMKNLRGLTKVCGPARLFSFPEIQKFSFENGNVDLFHTNDPCFTSSRPEVFCRKGKYAANLQNNTHVSGEYPQVRFKT